MNLSPMSDWHHGSTAPPRELSPDAKVARLEELRASHVRVTMRREIHAMALASDGFYAALIGAPEPLPQRANMRGYGVWQFDWNRLAAEDVRVGDEPEVRRPWLMAVGREPTQKAVRA